MTDTRSHVGAPEKTPIDGASSEGRIDLRVPRTSADKRFRVLLLLMASSVLIIILAIVGFLAVRGWSAFSLRGLRLIFADPWVPTARSYGFRGDLVGSVVIGIVALVVATPIALATALAVNEYVPKWMRSPLIAVIDLLAAVPSLVYGLWGKFFLQDHLFRTSIWLGHHADAFPLFRLVAGRNTNGSEFLAGIVVAIMILPLITAISREVMSQVPREDCEAALALGGTRWGMITDVILPFSRNGIIGGAMLGLGRAMGETIAVSLVLNANFQPNSHILQAGGGSIAATIATTFASVNATGKSALTVAGLVLFAITLTVNVVARIVVGRQGAASR